jgi:hypothetical protein
MPGPDRDESSGKRRRSVRLTHLEENISEAALLHTIRRGDLQDFIARGRKDPADSSEGEAVHAESRT